MRPAGAAVVVVGAGGLAAGVVVLVVEVGPAVVDVGASVDVVVSGTVVAGTLPAAQSCSCRRPRSRRWRRRCPRARGQERSPPRRRRPGVAGWRLLSHARVPG